MGAHAQHLLVDEPEFLRRHVDGYLHDRRSGWQPGKHILVGRQPPADAVQLMSNDYLCMADHRWVNAARRRVADAGADVPLMAAVFLQQGSPQANFENEMARFMGSEASVLSQSGWTANTGLIQAVVPADAPVYIDLFAHMSLWEGVHSARARAVRVRHNDVDHLQKQIRRHGPGVIVVDSVYSTSGHVAPLYRLVQLAKDYDCVLVVDESHSLGTHGPGGRGLVVGLGLEREVHFRTASLAKAFAGRAGIIACSERFAEFIKYRSNPAIFSSALLEPEIEVLRATLRAVRAADDRRAALRRNTRCLRDALVPMGIGVESEGEQIVALVAGEERNTIELRDFLESRGVFGSVFCAPATPRNGSLIRLTLNSELGADELQLVIDVISEAVGVLETSSWPARRGRRGFGNPAAGARIRAAA